MGTQGLASQLRGPSLQGVWRCSQDMIPQFVNGVCRSYTMHFVPHISKPMRHVQESFLLSIQ
jgi:hypothetical protein